MTRILQMPPRGLSALPETPQRDALRALPAIPGLQPIIRRLTQKHVSTRHIMVMTSQLATMLAAGCDLCAGLESLARQQPHPYLKKVLQELCQSVQSGRAFSQALAEHPDVVSPLYISIVRVGESSGNMRGMLQGLQVMLRNQIRLVSAIRGALLYPCILMTVAIAAIAVMTSFVLPRFSMVFRNSGVPLPTITTFTINCSEFAGRHFAVLAFGITALILGTIWVLRLPAVRPHSDAWALRLPLVGRALRLSYVVRSIQTLGLLIKSGLPVADALLLIRDLMPNVHYQRFFTRLHEHITEGKPIAPDFERTTLFPPMVAQMMAVGEQTGTLPAVCAEVAALHEEELNDRIKLLTTALEPMIIVFLGGFVALIAVSVILPMFRLSSTIK